MTLHIELGRKGEDLAEAFLLSRGFAILHRNWRYSRFEVDIIAVKNGIPHFVEVKCRSSGSFGLPEERVTKKKIESLLQAAEAFLFKHPQHKDFRLDILSIHVRPQKEPEYYFIEDVYL